MGQDAFQPVFGQDDRQPDVAVKAYQRLQHLLGRAGVELRGGFVEHEDARAERERRRDGDPLHLTAGERVQPAVPQRCQVQEIQHLLDARAYLGARDGCVLQRKGDFVLDPVYDELRLWILEDEPDDATEHLWPFGNGIVSGDEDTPAQRAAGKVGHQPVETAQERRLAHARWASHEDEFTLGDVERHAVQHGSRGTGICVAQVVKVYHTRSIGSLLASTAGRSSPSRPSPMNGSKVGRIRRG